VSAGDSRRGRVGAGLRTVRRRFRGLGRRDRLSLLAWIALTAALAPFAIGAPGRMHASEVVVPGTESARAQELGDRAFGREYAHLVLLQGPQNVLDERGPAIAASVAKLPQHRVLDPWSAGGRALRPTPDKAVLVVGIQKSFDAAGPDAARLRHQLRDEVKPPLTVHLTGFADLNRSIKDQTVKAMERSELIAAPLLILILILVLGSPIAAVMPLALGGCVAVMQIGTVDLINRYLTNLEVTAVAVGMAMSLGLGVDYALLLVARFRRELAAGASVSEATDTAVTHAGRTVMLAAIVLAFAMTAATVATPASVLKSATIGVLTAVAFSVLGARVALPPLLRWAGRDINRYQIVSPGSESKRWSGIAVVVLRRPVIAAVAVLALMLAISAPALRLQTGPPDARILPTSDPARADFDAVEHAIGASQSMPFVVTVVAHRGTLADGRLDVLARFGRELGRDRETAAVLGPAMVARQTAALAEAPKQLENASTDVTQLVENSRLLEDGLADLARQTEGPRARRTPARRAAARLRASQAAQLQGLQAGAKELNAQAVRLATGLGGIGELAGVLRSGYATIAAIASAPRAQRAAAAWAINWERGGNAVQYLVTQRASYGEGASTRDIPSRAGSPYRARLQKRVDRLAKQLHATAGVGGNQASIADFDQAAKDSLPRLVIVLVLATFVALVFVLRSWILAFVAVTLNVLTLLAAFGVMALAFGPDPLLGGPGFVDDIMVMVVYTVTFALSIDYAVFLLDRMREEWERHRSVEGAITYGIESTAGVITGAAVIMASVFVGFLLSPVVSLRQLGLALSVAVILDATVIRLVLLPAALRLVGERAWRTPRWLDPLYRRQRKKAESAEVQATPRAPTG